jgi:hypothetical protein
MLARVDAPSTAGYWKPASPGDEIMSYGASLFSNRTNPPIGSDFFRGSLGLDWLPEAIAKSASAEREIEVQVLMDRLLRQYFAPNTDAEICTAV